MDYERELSNAVMHHKVANVHGPHCVIMTDNFFLGLSSMLQMRYGWNLTDLENSFMGYPIYRSKDCRQDKGVEVL